MHQSTRLIINTMALIGQTIITVALSLVVTRIVVQELGLTDFGIFAAIGATTGLMMIVSNAMTDSCGRHLSHAVGANRDDTFQEVFNTALAIYTAAACVILALSAILAWPLVRVLTIPPERETAAAIVLITTGLRFAIITVQSPFRAATISRQYHTIIAGITTIQGFLRLFAALLLIVAPIDQLIMWAALLVVVDITHTLAIIAATCRTNPLTIPKPGLIRRRMIRELVAFGGWQLLGALSWRLRMQGAQIAVNLLFTPAHNAAYGLGTQAAGYQNLLAKPIGKAVQPAITASHGGEAHSRLRSLILVADKYTFIFSVILLVPLLLETPTLLSLWLGAERAAELAAVSVLDMTRLIALVIALQALTSGFIFGINATGKIATLALGTLVIDASTLALGVASVAMFDFGVVTIPAAAVLGMAAHAIFRATHAQRVLDLPATTWLRRTALPAMLTFIVALAAGFAVLAMVPESMLRLLLTTIAAGCATVGFAWLVALEPWERQNFVNFGTGAWNKLRSVLGRSHPTPGPGS
ncbi:MAG: oligosaccharide flippase family protein [Planctomycetota bacterium]